MAAQLDKIRTTAERIAASMQMDVVDLEFQGSGKFRSLRVYLEKNAAERAKLAERIAAGELEGTPSGVPTERLSGITHEDCALFAQDFGTVLDVEDLISGAEYTLEVSSPGLERKLVGAEDFTRFQGSLVSLRTFTAIESNHQWKGRLMKFEDGLLTLDLSAMKQKSKAKKVSADRVITIPLTDVEKANLVAEI